MISAVVLTKNEQENISDCLKSLKWCDEIIVIDDYSVDKTVKMAQTLGAKIYRRHLDNDFAGQRNFGLEKARGKWVLFVDADERISEALTAEIQSKVLSIKYNGFYLKRLDYFGGRWLKHGETATVRLLRLAKKGAGEWQREIHETWSFNKAQDKKIGELKNPLLHYPHQTISEFLDRINFYSDLHAKNKPCFWKIIFYPPLKFLQNYFWRLGFLDQEPGLIVALMMSLHSFLAQGKNYLKWKK